MFKRRGFFKRAILMVAGVLGAVTVKGGSVGGSPKTRKGYHCFGTKEQHPLIGKRMTQKNIINVSVPVVYEELARAYLPAIKQMTMPEVLRWMHYLMVYGGKIPAAVVSEMKIPTPGLVADQDRLDGILKAIDNKLSIKANIGWHIIWMITVIGIDRIHESD